MKAPKACIVSGCDQPKILGRGNRYCEIHSATAKEARRLDCLQRIKAWASENAEHVAAVQKEYQQRPEVAVHLSACARKRRREWRRANPRAAWSVLLWDRFRMTAGQYDALLALQGGCCAICGKPASAQERRLHVDHDHRCCSRANRSCGHCIRGLLCASCNQRLGWYENRRTVIAEYSARRVAFLSYDRSYLDDKHQSWSNYLIRKYHITANDYYTLLDEQCGSCYLCDRPATTQQRRLHVDHDHHCCSMVGESCGNCIRGLLCANCNNHVGWYERRREIVDDYADQTIDLVSLNREAV